MKSGYLHHLARGGQVGRKVGYRKSHYAMKVGYNEVIQCLCKSEKTAKAVTYQRVPFSG